MNSNRSTKRSVIEAALPDVPLDVCWIVVDYLHVERYRWNPNGPERIIGGSVDTIPAVHSVTNVGTHSHLMLSDTAIYRFIADSGINDDMLSWKIGYSRNPNEGAIAVGITTSTTNRVYYGSRLIADATTSYDWILQSKDALHQQCAHDGEIDDIDVWTGNTRVPVVDDSDGPLNCGCHYDSIINFVADITTLQIRFWFSGGRPYVLATAKTIDDFWLFRPMVCCSGLLKAVLIT